MHHLCRTFVALQVDLRKLVLLSVIKCDVPRRYCQNLDCTISLLFGHQTAIADQLEPPPQAPKPVQDEQACNKESSWVLMHGCAWIDPSSRRSVQRNGARPPMSGSSALVAWFGSPVRTPSVSNDCWSTYERKSICMYGICSFVFTEMRVWCTALLADWN